MKKLKPQQLLLVFLGAWWALNLLQGAFTGLANDESYYWLFSLQPAWGYFDHPPVTAWLVWLGRQVVGDSALGIRLFFTLLQPLYLWFLWRVIAPADPTRREVMLFGVAAAALPILQLYGFLAVPDGPLLTGSALFLWCFKRFTERDTWPWALLMGASIALLAYCKYHGALVVLLAVAANIKLLRNWKLYLAAAVALGLMMPHLLWQYDHHWASFAYHLSGRNKSFQAGYITEYVLNILLVFNPFFVPLYVQAWRKVRSQSPVERALLWICGGLILFFLASSIRGYVQPQWVIVSAFGLIFLLMKYLPGRKRSLRYAMVVGWATLALVGLMRIEMIFNPLGIRFEIFDNRESYGAIAQAAAGRPVIFDSRYAIASKYAYYTGGETYCQPKATHRTSQWQLIDADSAFIGRPALVQVEPAARGDYAPDSLLTLANGMKFAYKPIDNYLPVRKITISIEEPLPGRMTRGGLMALDLRIDNPYDFDQRDVELVMIWSRHAERRFEEFALRRLDLPAHGTQRVMLDFRVQGALLPGDYRVGFAIRRAPLGYWYNSPVSQIHVRQ